MEPSRQLSSAVSVMGGKPGSKVCEKKESPEVLDSELHDAAQKEIGRMKKQLSAEPIEEQVRLLTAILRINISALGRTFSVSSPEGAAVSSIRREALNQLIKMTNEFERMWKKEIQKTPITEELHESVSIVLGHLSDVFVIFGRCFRGLIVHLTSEEVDDIKKGKDPLQKEKEELARMEERAKKVQEREAMERKKREKAEKDKKKNKKKNRKKSKQAQITNEYDPRNDELGDERVPPQLTSCAHHTCRCQHHQNREPEFEMMAASEDMSNNNDLPSVASLDLHERKEPQQAATRSASVSSTVSSSDDKPVTSRIMTTEQWSQFCRIYDRGSKK